MLEHFSVRGAFVGVVGEEVPRAELKLVERGEREKFFDERGAVVGALAQTNGGELGERTDGCTEPAARKEAAGDERGGHGTQAGQQNAQLSLGGLNLRGFLHGCLLRGVRRVTFGAPHRCRPTSKVSAGSQSCHRALGALRPEQLAAEHAP